MMGFPPLFKQGASVRIRASFFALIAVIVLIIDVRLHTLTLVHQTIGTLLYPLQTLALMPRAAFYQVSHYFASLSILRQENNALRRQQLLSAPLLQQAHYAEMENAHLRDLLKMQQKHPIQSLVGEILYDARDPFTRKIMINRGSWHGVVAGQPVIDDTGIVGQITRTFPFTAEVSLLTDKDQAIPVQVLRTGLRSVAYGLGQSGILELRFVTAHADIRNNDILITSGIDDVYPPGLLVARVLQVETELGDAFAHVTCLPSAGIDRHKQLLILLPSHEKSETSETK